MEIAVMQTSIRTKLKLDHVVKTSQCDIDIAGRNSVFLQ
jgi:hypothetical protein